MIGAATLNRCRLYGIVDLGYVSAADAARIAREMITGGVDIIQLRGKEQPSSELMCVASELREVTLERGVPLIINDHPDIACSVGADGVHVGQDDMSVAEARRRARHNCLVGRSTHSYEQAVRAAGEGADYIGFGPLFPTPTKPDYTAIGLSDISLVHGTLTLPIFCIGGIKRENLPDVIAAGARRVVIVSGLLQADDIADYSRSSKALLDEAWRT